MGTNKLTPKNVKVGDRLKADDCFLCLDEGAVRVVSRDKDGDLFVRCRDGRHYLEGQLRRGRYVGFSRAAI